jgi:hypothetical protein
MYGCAEASDWMKQKGQRSMMDTLTRIPVIFISNK